MKAFVLIWQTCAAIFFPFGLGAGDPLAAFVTAEIVGGIATVWIGVVVYVIWLIRHGRLNRR